MFARWNIKLHSYFFLKAFYERIERNYFASVELKARKYMN